MDATERLARALATELAYTAGEELRELVRECAPSLYGKKSPNRGPLRLPHEDPAYLLGRDPDWRALVVRALEVAECEAVLG